MDLFAIGDQCVSGERVVVLPAGQLTDTTYRAVDGSQSAAVTLSPNHPFVIGGGDLATTLDQFSVGIEKQLTVEQRAAVTFVHADGNHHAGAPRGFPEGVRRRRWHGDRLLQQSNLFGAHLIGSLHKRKVRIVRNNGFRKSRELHSPRGQFVDLRNDPLNGTFTAV